MTVYLIVTKHKKSRCGRNIRRGKINVFSTLFVYSYVLCVCILRFYVLTIKCYVKVI